MFFLIPILSFLFSKQNSFWKKKSQPEKLFHQKLQMVIPPCRMKIWYVYIIYKKKKINYLIYREKNIPLITFSGLLFISLP